MVRLYKSPESVGRHFRAFLLIGDGMDGGRPDDGSSPAGAAARRGPDAWAVIALVLSALGASPAGIALGAFAFAKARRKGGDLFVPLVAIGIGIGGMALWAVLFYMYTDVSSREKSVLVELSRLVSAQEEFRKARHVDQDGDGEGEYGLLAELSGGPEIRIAGGVKASPIAGSGLISSVYGNITERGCVEKYGYYFAVFLPGSSWDAAVTDRVRVPAGEARLSGPQEKLWCAFAWPAVAGGTAGRAFFVDQSGEIYETENSDRRYDGYARMPIPRDVNDSRNPNPGGLGAPKAWTSRGPSAGGAEWRPVRASESGKGG